MIDGNVLKFGYGDIGVEADSLMQRIRFWQIKPPANCGDNLVISNIEFIAEPVYVCLKDIHEYSQFVNLLDESSPEKKKAEKIAKDKAIREKKKEISEKGE